MVQKEFFLKKCQVYIKTLHSIHINKVSLCDVNLFSFQSVILTGNIDTWPFICVSFSFVLDLTVYFMENDKNMCSNIQQRPFLMSDWQPGLVVAVCFGEHTLRYSSICTTCSTGGLFFIFRKKLCSIISQGCIYNNSTSLSRMFSLSISALYLFYSSIRAAITSHCDIQFTLLFSLLN